MKSLKKIITTLPGFDPYRDAGECKFVEKKARHAIEFFEECLTHVKGKGVAGKPFLLGDWQKAIVANIWGWIRPDGTRRFREVLIYVPRKNGKTTLAAGIALACLCIDGEPGAEIVSVANKEDQAKLCLSIAQKMVRNDESLKDVCEVFIKSIVYKDSVYKTVSSEAKSLDGLNTHCAIIDEIHKMVSPDILDLVQTSTGARSQPLIVYTTTADVERESVCNDKYDYAKHVLEGLHDPAFLPVIYEAARDDDHNDPKVWAKANPNLGASIYEDYIKREFEKAKATPSYLNTVLRYHLNVRTEQTSRWLSIDHWNACGSSEDPVLWRARMMQSLKGHSCYGGLDLGSTSDLTALVLMFNVSSRTVMLPFFWVPEDGDWKRGPYRVHYESWIRQGFIYTTPGDTADYEYIRTTISGVHNHGDHDRPGLADDYGIKELPVDRAFQGAHLCTLLGSDGIEIMAYPQTFNYMTAPSREFERRVIAHEIDHGNNPVLRWMASNVASQEDATGKLIRPAKPKNQKHLKIDGIVAAIMALARLIVDQPSGYKRSTYDTPTRIWLDT